MRALQLMPRLLSSACLEPTASVSGGLMDEVPVQQFFSSGDREYRFANGCVIVLQPDRAIVLTESEACEQFHCDIALLYASADCLAQRLREVQVTREN